MENILKIYFQQEVHCILFTDMLLICKMVSKRADRLRVTKPPMHISNLRFHHFSEGSQKFMEFSKKFFLIFSWFLLDFNERV